MNLKTLNVGDDFFGIIYKYSGRFLDTIRIKKCTVQKVNSKSILISFNSETKKHPQRFQRGDAPACNINKTKVATDFLEHLPKATYPGYVKRKMKRYCKYIIKKEEAKNETK